jgi:hypothetical protein
MLIITNIGCPKWTQSINKLNNFTFSEDTWKLFELRSVKIRKIFCPSSRSRYVSPLAWQTVTSAVCVPWRDGELRWDTDAWWIRLPARQGATILPDICHWIPRSSIHRTVVQSRWPYSVAPSTARLHPRWLFPVSIRQSSRVSDEPPDLRRTTVDAIASILSEMLSLNTE